MKNLLKLFVIALLSLNFIGVAAARAQATTLVKSVCIDPGHGGTDPGAVNQSLRESDVNLDVAQRLGALLTANGYSVYYTRTGDTSVDLRGRAAYCNSTNAGIAISIHQNSSTSQSADYTSGFYFKSVDKPLATMVAGSVSQNLGLTNNGISHYANRMLMDTNMPSTLAESLFLSNPMEYALLTDGTGNRQQQEAQGLYNGISSYFASKGVN